MRQDQLERFDCDATEYSDTDVVAKEILANYTGAELRELLAYLVSIYNELPDMLHHFWQRTSDACPLEATEQEAQVKEWRKWTYTVVTNHQP